MDYSSETQILIKEDSFYQDLSMLVLKSKKTKIDELRFGAVWTGDNSPTYEHMKASI